MSKAREITSGERAEIERSVDRAWADQAIQFSGEEPERQSPVWIQNAITARDQTIGLWLDAIRSGRGSALDHALLRRWIGYSGSDSSDLIETFGSALISRDASCFKIMAALIEQGPIGDTLRRRMNPVKHFLLSRWATGRSGSSNGDSLELFYLSPDSIARICRHETGQHFTEYAFGTARRRLGLKSFRRQKKTVQIRAGKIIVAASR